MLNLCDHCNLQDSEDVNYRSHGYTGPRPHRDTEDPLAGEIMLSDSVEKQESAVVERLVASPVMVTPVQGRHRRSTRRGDNA